MVNDKAAEPLALREPLAHRPIEVCGEPSSEDDPRAPRTLRVVNLWAIGVGAVIAGDFFGWQAVLASGFWPGLIALLGSTVMYLLLSCCVAEVTAKLESGAGPGQFAAACFGPRWAFLTGTAEALKCILVVSVVTAALGAYLTELLGSAPRLAPAWWAGSLTALAALNAVFAKSTAKFQLLATTSSVVILLVFFTGIAIRGFDFNRYAGASSSTSKELSFWSVIKVWPFGLWFYLGIEELPLSMSETVDAGKAMPRGLLHSFFTLMMVSFLMLFLAASIPPGAIALANEPYPLLLGYFYLFGDSAPCRYGCLILTAGLMASLHAFFGAATHLIAQMSEDGHFPNILSRRSRRTGASWVAVLVTSLASFLLLCFMYGCTGRDADIVGDLGIAATLFCTLLSYSVQLACFLKLRVGAQHEDVTFTSPFGIPGAIIAMMLCAASLLSVLCLPFADLNYLAGIGLAVGMLASMLTGKEASCYIRRQPFCNS